MEVDRLSVKHSRDQSESVLSCETQISSHWGVERAGEESEAIGVCEAAIPLSLLNRLFQTDYGFVEQSVSFHLTNSVFQIT